MRRSPFLLDQREVRIADRAIRKDYPGLRSSLLSLISEFLLVSNKQTRARSAPKPRDSCINIIIDRRVTILMRGCRGAGEGGVLEGWSIGVLGVRECRSARRLEGWNGVGLGSIGIWVRRLETS